MRPKYSPQAPRELWEGELTDHQAATLEQIALGKTTSEAAEALLVGEQTIKSNLTEVYAKLDVKNRVEVARWWWENVELVESRRSQLEVLANLRAYIEVERDVDERTVHVQDGVVLASWQERHRLHSDAPYIGCVFCRDQFYSRAEVERAILVQTSDVLDEEQVRTVVDEMTVAFDEYVARTLERIRDASS